MMTEFDINDLSREEIESLEKQIKEYKSSKKMMKGYKVTFYVRFNPETYNGSTSILDSESFQDWLSDYAQDIEQSFGFTGAERVSFPVVEEATKEELNF